MIKTFQKYINQHAVTDKLHTEPRPDTGIIVVIPCYNEPLINKTLDSLCATQPPPCFTEVIVVINQPENTPQNIAQQNHETYHYVKRHYTCIRGSHLHIHPLFLDNVPARHAGAGFARKTGMDQAVLRFFAQNNPLGIIVSLDADTLVQTNYLRAIHKQLTDTSIQTACIHFEHPTALENKKLAEAITLYELHLRYVKNALQISGFPYPFHTVGSAFAVRAGLYVKQGGMNRKKAGEDFYFLHKLFPAGHNVNITETTVIPSSRISDRVPFGTGPSLQNHMHGAINLHLSYNLKLFIELNQLFTNIGYWFSAAEMPPPSDISICMGEFLIYYRIPQKLAELSRNCARMEVFRKRFFEVFDAFTVVKFLNYASSNHIPKQALSKACNTLLTMHLSKESVGENSFELLEKFREIDKGATHFPLQ